jgi:oligopeptide/dipeptide ABC transporter ATP-binding protein
MNEPILEVDDLATSFETERGTVNAVDGVSFSLDREETMGIVGESGSGKSVTALSIMGLIDSPGRIERGTVRYRGEDLLEKSEQEMQEIRGAEIAMIFQDPLNSLNPVLSVGEQIERVIRTHQDRSNAEARDEAIDLLDRVGIPSPAERIDDYPHQFSGGMQQRALIAMAISCNPSVLIADEPTTALDVTIEAQIFELLDDLQSEFGMSTILITHDLGVVAGACDDVSVMYGGQMVERASVDELFADPRHPYTRGLLRSIPRPAAGETELRTIEGDVPDPVSLPGGCSFHPRCPHATADCREHDPELREAVAGHDVACLNAAGYGWHAADGSQGRSGAAATDGGSHD